MKYCHIIYKTLRTLHFLQILDFEKLFHWNTLLFWRRISQLKVILVQIAGCRTLSELFLHIDIKVPTISAFIRYKRIDIKMGPFLLLTVVSGARREVRSALWKSDNYLLSVEEYQTSGNPEFQRKIIFTGLLLCPFSKTVLFLFL